jgi:hypothetical protein
MGINTYVKVGGRTWLPGTDFSVVGGSGTIIYYRNISCYAVYNTAGWGLLK